MNEELRCQFCGGNIGHYEHLKNNDGYDMWFCCHTCRDAGRACETFFDSDKNGNLRRSDEAQ